MKHFRTPLLLLVAVSSAPTFAADAEAGLLAIKALGGVYLRADAAGTFSAVLPDGGKYYVLLISQKTRRPPDSAKFGLARWLGKLHDFILSIVPVGDGRWIAVNSTTTGRRVEFNVDALGVYLSQAVAAGSAAAVYNLIWDVLTTRRF